MPSTQPILRLVRDDDPPRVPDFEDDLHMQLASMRNEVATLTAELTSLRLREQDHDSSLQRLGEELRLAARLQQDFLPKSLPQLGRVAFHALFRPAGYVSGDFYDVMRLDEKHVGFYIADAVGHGVPAALLTMFIKHALATKQIEPAGGYRLLSPAETLARLNDRLLEQNLSAATFASALYGSINAETLTVRFARGGHPSPILLRGDCRHHAASDTPAPLEALECDGGLLGIFPDETFSERQVTLRSGDKLVLFTDGTDVLFSDSNVLQSQHRWCNELRERRSLPGGQLVQELAAVVDQEREQRPLKDDLTVLVVEAR